MYKVIKHFVDLKDNKHYYRVGDVYPHDNRHVSLERIEELKSTENKLGVSLIEEIEEKPKKKKQPKEESEI